MSTFMDRYSTPLWKSQTGFIDFLVYPLFESFMNHFDNGEFNESLLSQIKENRERWKQMSEVEDDSAEK